MLDNTYFGGSYSTFDAYDILVTGFALNRNLRLPQDYRDNPAIFDANGANEAIGTFSELLKGSFSKTPLPRVSVLSLPAATNYFRSVNDIRGINASTMVGLRATDHVSNTTNLLTLKHFIELVTKHSAYSIELIKYELEKPYWEKRKQESYQRVNYYSLLNQEAVFSTWEEPSEPIFVLEDKFPLVARVESFTSFDGLAFSKLMELFELNIIRTALSSNFNSNYQWLTTLEGIIDSALRDHLKETIDFVGAKDLKAWFHSFTDEGLPLFKSSADDAFSLEDSPPSGVFVLLNRVGQFSEYSTLAWRLPHFLFSKLNLAQKDGPFIILDSSLFPVGFFDGLSALFIATHDPLLSANTLEVASQSGSLPVLKPYPWDPSQGRLLNSLHEYFKPEQTQEIVDALLKAVRSHQALTL